MFKKIFLSILAIIVIFEEWLWDGLAFIGQILSHILHLEKLDNWLINATAYQALFSLFIPIAIVTPFNILALFLLANGAILQGILLEIVLKLTGTLLIAHIFKLVKTALLTLNWFAKIYYTISNLLNWAHKVIQSTTIYKLSIQIKAAVKIKTAQLWLIIKGT